MNSADEVAGPRKLVRIHNAEPGKRGSAAIKVNLPDMPELSEAMTRVMSNVARVQKLLEIYDNVRRSTYEGRGRSNVHAKDLLRACVVLLHATLEDGLRNLLRFRLPRTREVFDDIALAGINDTGRPEKFLLGRLERFRGKTIDEVWNESLAEHLTRRSFNSGTDLATALKQIKAGYSCDDALLGSLSDLISRRHHIVHNADINEQRGRQGQQFARSLGRRAVAEWAEAVVELFLQILDALAKERAAAMIAVPENQSLES